MQAANLSARLIDILLYFALPYGVLLVISFCFHTKSVEQQMAFPIWPLPSAGPQKLIYYVAVIALGIIGVYVLIGNYWAASTWILYAVGCLLLAGYVFIYSLTNRFTLFLASGIAVALAVDMEWLFIETRSMNQNGISDQIIRNLVGGIGAWAVIYALLTLGQLFVSLGFNRKVQAVLFFILGILAIGLIAYWNRTSYAEWKDLIGFIGVGAFLLIFSLLNSNNNSKKDLENLLWSSIFPNHL